MGTRLAEGDALPVATTRSASAWSRWAQFLFFTVAASAWPLIVLSPGTRAARCIARWAAWLWLRGTATPLTVRGLQHLRGLRLPCVLVGNHASKLDAIVVLAALPLRFGFVAKIELARRAWLRWPLQRLGVLFVQRDGHKSGPSDTDRAIDMLGRGDSLLFFPEGTVDEQPGLLPFHRGAFVAAVHASVAVLPFALRGTRAVLPDASRPPRRGAVEIDVGAPLAPDRRADPAANAMALLQQARAFIAARCGEPDRAP